MDKFKEKEIKKIWPIKSTQYDWLINYIPERIRKSVGGFNDKVISLFDTNTPKQIVYRRGKKLNKSKKQKQSENDDYQKPKRVSNFRNNNSIEYKSNGHRNKNLSLDEYLDKIRV